MTETYTLTDKDKQLIAKILFAEISRLDWEKDELEIKRLMMLAQTLGFIAKD